jgi:uncharacterized membrane protein YbhN (UPF0104 family)/mRNA-degrading endonuclease RelE of RelBE toxin-antitoxin system
LNYNAGQGLLAYYLKKNGGTSWLVAGGTIFYVMLTDFFILVSAVRLSLAFAPVDDGVWISLKHTSSLIFITLVGALLAIKGLPRLFKPLAAKMADKAWYSFIYHYSWSNIARTLLYRACYISITVSGLYLPFLPFHVDVPFSYVVASTPPVFIIGALPITPSGLGTAQAAFIYFFSKVVSSPLLAPGESPDNLLLALILAWAFASLVLKLSVGVYFNFRARRVKMSGRRDSNSLLLTTSHLWDRLLRVAWKIQYQNAKRIQKAVSKMRPSTRATFDRALEDLKAEGPSPKGWHVKALHGNYKGTMAMRLDIRHRVLYEVESGILMITIVEVTTRENAYK